MNKLIVLLGGLCFLLTPIVSTAQEKGALTIVAHHFSNDQGIAVVNLFRETDDVPKQFFKQIKANIEEGVATLIFSDIPYDDYAAIVFQDENSNGILDHKLGFPNEPMGFSNEWKLTLFSGMPNFEKLKFRFDVDHSTCRIKM